MANQIQGRDNGCAGRRQSRRAGSVLMECVLVLPLLTLLIFAIVQFALLWNAQIMTHYAAYNAARAALVYHPAEYRKEDGLSPEFQVSSGVCWEAAWRTLAWVSSSPDMDSGTKYKIPGWWLGAGGDSPVPASSCIENQVRIVGDGQSAEMTDAPIVKVTVAFDFPLHVPVIGRMIAYFDHLEAAHPSSWEVTGWRPAASAPELDKALHHPVMGVDYVTLLSTVMLPKPWRTSHFARRPAPPASR